MLCISGTNIAEWCSHPRRETNISLGLINQKMHGNERNFGIKNAFLSRVFTIPLREKAYH